MCHIRQVAHEPLEPPSGSRTVRKRVAPPPKYMAVSGLSEPLACYFFCARSENHWVAPASCATGFGTVVFRSNRQSRITHPPIDIEIWQRSRVTRPVVEPPERHTELKIACKTQKSENFRFDVENFAGVTPNFGCCRNVELVFWVTRHTQCQFERNTTVFPRVWRSRTARWLRKSTLSQS
jgi:hypothetical protein